MADTDLRLLVEMSGAVDLLDLRLVPYRGCMIRESRLNQANVDDWLLGLDGDVRAVEDVVNHQHLEDFWGDRLDAGEAAELVALAERIADLWRTIAAARYPEHRLVVDCYCDEDGPTLTIYQAS